MLLGRKTKKQGYSWLGYGMYSSIISFVEHFGRKGIKECLKGKNFLKSMHVILFPWMFIDKCKPSHVRDFS